MKKSNVILVMLSVMGIITASCVKENETTSQAPKQASTATAVKIAAASLKTTPGNSSGYLGTYVLSARAGHSSSECGGGCVLAGGVRKHLNCQGFGSSCGLKASVCISKVKTDSSSTSAYIAIGLNDYEPTDEHVFYMPARSFYIEDETTKNGYIWLNIPEQVLERDAENNQFVYYNISFTENALFENL
jgi:hypothetical protein